MDVDVLVTPIAMGLSLPRDVSQSGFGVFRVDTLASTRRLGDSLTFGRITSLRVVRGRLVVTDALTRPHIHILDIATGVVVKQFGAHGDGPGEYRDPQWVHGQPGDSGAVWVYDYVHRRLTLEPIS